jgi:hypothetical protein
MLGLQQHLHFCLQEKVTVAFCDFWCPLSFISAELRVTVRSPIILFLSDFLCC